MENNNNFAMPRDSIVTFSSVSKTYAKEIGAKAHRALADLSFSVQQGTTLGLIGANGAGKSTSIRLLMDFVRPTSGQIRLFDDTPSRSQLHQEVGYLPETANFPPNLNVLDLLKLTATTCGLSKKEFLDRSEELLHLLDLWEARNKPLRTYSKGMQQRANFTIALINDPKLLILDEPMSGLDPIGRKKIIDLVLRLKAEGKTILFCSHILEDVDKLVDSILLLHKGKRIFFGTPKELIADEKVSTISDAFVTRISRETDNG